MKAKNAITQLCILCIFHHFLDFFFCIVYYASSVVFVYFFYFFSFAPPTKVSIFSHSNRQCPHFSGVRRMFADNQIFLITFYIQAFFLCIFYKYITVTPRFSLHDLHTPSRKLVLFVWVFILLLLASWLRSDIPCFCGPPATCRLL